MTMQLTTSSQKILDQFSVNVPQWNDQLISIIQCIDLICGGYRRHVLLMTCGNGGSASDASHIVGELVKSFRMARPIDAELRARLINIDPQNGAVTADQLQCGLRAVSLSSESVLLTAMGNDVGFEMCFAQQVCALGCPGDILLGLSTSGRSTNVIKALQVAKAKGIHTIGMAGNRPCPMRNLCDIYFPAPADETYRIQEFHLALYHVICAVVENQLFDTHSYYCGEK